MTPVWAIGLMTGTIIDGYVDIALIKTDGVDVFELGQWSLEPYPEDLSTVLTTTLASALEWKFAGPEPAVFHNTEKALTLAQAKVVRRFMENVGIEPEEVSVIGFHGQTVLHRAPDAAGPGRTRQLGDGQLMADLLGVDVAYDFRTADMLAGGHGAPLSAGYHSALMRFSRLPRNSAVLNLGGVANITWWGGKDDYVGFDSGPANGPINDWVARCDLGDMDVGGALARAGRVDERRVREMLAHPFFSAPFPKSLDRYDFREDMVAGLSPADGAATLTAFVGGTIDRAMDLMPERPHQVIVCGGGRNNAALVEAIRERANVHVVLAEDYGWRGDAVEAECFAYLGVRVACGLPITYPLTTGVKKPMAGGRVISPSTVKPKADVVLL